MDSIGGKMLSQLTEKKMHLVRWLLVIGWLALVFSAFYDPISLKLTDPASLWSPVHVHLDRCVLVQGECLPQSSYVLAPQIFWGIVVPVGVIILLVGGHEIWRRICPLYFISQIPRRLGLQRKQDKVNPANGSVRRDLVGVKATSWLGKNYAYLQFGLLFLGLNLRLLVANGNGVGFGCFVLLSIAGALLVGYLFKGRSWCQYFCPMAPVQIFYTSNRGLLGSDAHLSPAASVTQSMCRSTDENGKEKSACVSCQSPCIDIDSERTYWANLESPERKLLFYGYFGLMLGFFVYFYLYAGNWDYYFSGVWSHDPQQFSSLLKPGFYVGGRSIGIPKILAVPLTLGFFTAASYYAGTAIEHLLTIWSKRQHKKWNAMQIRHICFVWAVFISFNVFFIFAGRPNLKLLPGYIEVLFNAFYILVSTLWLQRNLGRSKLIYQRESLTGSLRRQLQKLAVNWKEFLEGRSINDLDTNEVYVLAKVLPGFNHQSRLQVYQGVLQEALNEGKTQSADSLEMLQGMREELQITTDEHYNILDNLGIENPDLLNPTVQRNREDRLRLDSYQRYLETILLDLVSNQASIEQAFLQKQGQIEAMRQEYSITNDEQEKVLLAMFHPNSTLLSTSVQLLINLQLWSMRYQALTQSSQDKEGSIYSILQAIILDHQKSIIAQLFNILEILANDPIVTDISATTGYLAPEAVQELLLVDQDRLTPFICETLKAHAQLAPRCILSKPNHGLNTALLNSASTKIIEIGSQPIPEVTLMEVLQDLLFEVDPLVKAVSLYTLNQIDLHQAKIKACVLDGGASPLVQEIVNQVLQRPQPTKLVPTITLDLVVHNEQECLVFSQPIVSLGRALGNDILILDNQISRKHAIFKVDDNGIILRDIGSSTGLRLGTTCLKDDEQTLPSGTKVMLCPNNDITLTAHWSLVEKQAEFVTTIEKLLWFRASKFFDPFCNQNLVDLAYSSSLIVYDEGEVLCQQGTPANALLLIISGKVQIGEEMLGAGKVLGELGILTKSTYRETVVAHAPKTLVLVTTANSVNDLLDRDAQLARALLVSVSQRLQLLATDFNLCHDYLSTPHPVAI
jgi:Cyclic nucleotide-binding domain/FHA domain